MSGFFCAYCQYAVHDLHSSSNFDFTLGEHTNHCRGDDVPYQAALDAMAAVRWFLPRLRGSTTTAKSYLRNRQRTCVVQQTTPLPVECMHATVAAPCMLRVRCGCHPDSFSGCLARIRNPHPHVIANSMLPGLQLPRALFQIKQNRSAFWVCRVITDHWVNLMLHFWLGANGTRVQFAHSMTKR